MGGGWILAGTNIREPDPVLLNEGEDVGDGDSESQREDEGEGEDKGECDVDRASVGARIRVREWGK